MIQAILFAATVLASPSKYQKPNHNTGNVQGNNRGYQAPQHSGNKQQFVPANTNNNGKGYEKYGAPNPSGSWPNQPVTPKPTTVGTQSNPNGATSYAISGVMTVLFVMASL